MNETVEYIHRNPVRRGWVVKPENWIWSGAAELVATVNSSFELTVA